MPIFYQQDIDEDTRLGIWKIEEDENFFLQSVVPQRNVSHPHKKLQHLAGRYLLKYLFPDFPLSLILIADTRKPYLENEAYHFSISHCGDYAAAIVSKTKRVGVDIEMATQKVERIQYKFLTEEELAIGNGQRPMSNEQLTTGNKENTTLNSDFDIERLTLLWSCKEAVFKWYGLGEVDFKSHIITKSITPLDNHSFETIISFEKQTALYLNLKSHIFKELPVANCSLPIPLVLSYVVT